MSAENKPYDHLDYFSNFKILTQLRVETEPIKV